MSTRATGSFVTTMTPEPPYDSAPGATLGRINIAKRFEGDLTGSGSVAMLSAMTGVKGSAGYVAIERVDGTLHGRAGSFVLQHSGTMNRGSAALTVTVVPDSGTGALEGISGEMAIDTSGGGHRYTFDYDLAAPR
jgi:hypothetical protein